MTTPDSDPAAGDSDVGTDDGINAADGGGLGLQLLGVGLFLFIPLVLFLYLAHPEPIAFSLIAGFGLMIGHRFLARPYMERVRERKCLWCNRIPPRGGGDREIVTLTVGSRPHTAYCCRRHDRPVRRFFAFVDRLRWPLRLAIFVPLLCLLGMLTAAAFFGHRDLLPDTVAWFRLVIGLAVNLAAFGVIVPQGTKSSPPVPFPVHNFYLLGLRNLLWVFRLMGLWWIVLGARTLFF